MSRLSSSSDVAGCPGIGIDRSWPVAVYTVTVENRRKTRFEVNNKSYHRWLYPSNALGSCLCFGGAAIFAVVELVKRLTHRV